MVGVFIKKDPGKCGTSPTNREPRGFQGHGGRFWGYSSAMYMVEEEQGAYGFVLLINNSMAESLDTPWAFAIQLNLQDFILQEAYRIYQTQVLLN
jgi:hypothetical protein